MFEDNISIMDYFVQVFLQNSGNSEITRARSGIKNVVFL